MCYIYYMYMHALEKLTKNFDKSFRTLCMNVYIPNLANTNTFHDI